MLRSCDKDATNATNALVVDGGFTNRKSGRVLARHNQAARVIITRMQPMKCNHHLVRRNQV